MTATQHNSSSDESCIRVVVSGSECTGKTVLTRALAANFDVPFSTESARDYVNELGRAVQFSDVEPIARRQIEIEDALLGNSSRMYIFDTDLFSTLIYSRLYFGRCPGWIEPLCRARRADLYLLCGIDLPWVKDDFQRGQDTPTERQHAHSLFSNVLNKNGCSIRAVSGLNDNRLQCAISAIETWPSSRTTTVDQASESS
jgi:NadR type nicotinamide-nucleotide adenylyltransferase